MLPIDVVEFIINSVHNSGFGTTNIILFIIGFYVASNGLSQKLMKLRYEQVSR